MRQLKEIPKPAQINDLTFDELYDEISRDWQLKARRLQARRLRALKHSTKELGNLGRGM